MMKRFVPEGTESEDVGDPAGELDGEAAADIQKVSKHRFFLKKNKKMLDCENFTSIHKLNKQF